MKLETSGEIELIHGVFLSSKSNIIKKPSNSIKTKHKRVESHNEHTMEDYKNCPEVNKKFIEIIAF